MATPPAPKLVVSCNSPEKSAPAPAPAPPAPKLVVSCSSPEESAPAPAPAPPLPVSICLDGAAPALAIALELGIAPGSAGPIATDTDASPPPSRSPPSPDREPAASAAAAPGSSNGSVDARRHRDRPQLTLHVPAPSSSSSGCGSSHPARYLQLSPRRFVVEPAGAGTNAAFASPSIAGGAAAGDSSVIINRRRSWSPVPEIDAPSSSSDPATPPDGLEILEHMGGGAYADVYRARWRTNAVVVRVIRTLQTEDAASLARFRSEVAALHLLRHPSLVLFMGASIQPPNLFIVNEYLPGGSLERRIHGPGGGPLPLTETLALAHTVATGLHYLRMSGYPHRHAQEML
eukprot:tig00020510_g9816.t1